MKVVIQRADYDDLLEDYPCLEKYKAWFIPKDCEYDYSEFYYSSNCIVKDMDNDELFKLIQELTSYEDIVIGYADKYDHEKYGIDFKITIYDYYLE